MKRRSAIRLSKCGLNSNSQAHHSGQSLGLRRRPLTESPIFYRESPISLPPRLVSSALSVRGGRETSALARYAAGAGERVEMIRDSSRGDAPRTSSDRTRRSSDTVGLPASILATRDWLEPSSVARSACVRRCRCRRSRRLVASRTLRSMNTASSAISRRNSCELPTFQPFVSSRRCLSLRTVVLPESPEGRFDDGWRRSPGLLAEDLQDHDRVRIHPVHDSPVRPDIADTQFVTGLFFGRLVARIRIVGDIWRRWITRGAGPDGRLR